jgi:hypothetical protein
MGVIERLFSSARVGGREDFRQAAARVLPNSFDGESDSPIRLAVSRRRINVRNMDQLIGMCNMVLADGAVEDHEAQFLLNWMESNLYAAHEWPGNVLYERLLRAVVDGHIDPDEERELLDVIQQLAGAMPTPEGPGVSGAIPFDDPPPEIVHEGRAFVLTGQFVYGPRKTVAAEIESRGGVIKPNCSKKISFLVVGTVGSEEWLHSTHGTKIIRAVELKQEGQPLAIVREQAWVQSLG